MYHYIRKNYLRLRVILPLKTWCKISINCLAEKVHLEFMLIFHSKLDVEFQLFTKAKQYMTVYLNLPLKIRDTILRLYNGIILLVLQLVL